MNKKNFAKFHMILVVNFLEENYDSERKKNVRLKWWAENGL